MTRLPQATNRSRPSLTPFAAETNLIAFRPFPSFTAYLGQFPSESACIVLLALMPLALLMAPLSSVLILPLLAMALIWLTCDEHAEAWPWRALGDGWVWVMLFALMFASAGWAIDRAAAFSLALRLLLLSAAGMSMLISWHALPPSVADRLVVAIGWGMSGAACLVTLDLIFGCPLAGLIHGTVRTTPLADVYSRGAVFLAIGCVPLGLALWRRAHPRLAVLLLVAAGAAVFGGEQAAAKLALAAAIVVAAIIFAIPRLRWGVLAAILVFGLTAPFLLPHQPSRSEACWLVVHKPSALHRMLIWDWVDQRILEHPLIGWGLDAARRMPGGHARVVVHGCDDPAGAPPRLDNEILPLHPHDAALQIWLELGALGAIAVAFGLGWSIARAYRRDGGRMAASAMTAALIAATVAAAVSFGIWQEWWFAVLWLVAWLATPKAPGERRYA